MNEAEKANMACKICGVPLNRLLSFATGEIEWRHSRTWQTYDHDPVPVPADQAPTVEGRVRFLLRPGHRVRLHRQ